MTKQEVINVIKELPDNVTVNQIISVIRIREQTLDAIASMDAGEEVLQEDIDAMVDEWLTE